MFNIDVGYITSEEKKFIGDKLQEFEERIKRLENSLDKSYQMLDNTLRGLKELKDLLVTNPQPAKEEGLYPWHRKDLIECDKNRKNNKT